MIRRLSNSITRPNDTAQYTAGDVIGTAATHIIALQNNIEGVGVEKAVYRATLTCSAAPATLPSLEVWLFHTAPAAQADNEAFAVTDAEILNVIGVMPLTTTYVGLASGNHIQQSDNSILTWKSPTGFQNLFAVLVVRNAYTPTALEVYNLSIDFE
jgi:hypothetical protein